MKNLTLVLVAAFAVSCATRTKVLDTAAISMTHDSLQEGTALEMKGPVTAEFCPDAFADKGSIGLMDEAVKRAQTQAQVDYIINATFWKTGNNCMQVEGDGAKVVQAKAATTGTKIKK